MLKSFVVGVIAGGVAYWLWEDEIRRFVDANTLDIRKRAADTLKQAESLVESASETIGQTIHAGQEAMRPAARSSIRSAK
ncbi:MAG TPA: hypothetical protein VFF62_02830 [Candidatus Nitrosocosmicus sp.]|jgi:hypothetical protein|nr:hypothetical protein [Candidatus Nitrosocosmicus sp.]